MEYETYIKAIKDSAPVGALLTTSRIQRITRLDYYEAMSLLAEAVKRGDMQQDGSRYKATDPATKKAL